MHAITLRSGDPVESVACWYRETMARLSRFLDFSQVAAADAPPLPNKQVDEKVLRCGRDLLKATGVL